MTKKITLVVMILFLSISSLIAQSENSWIGPASAYPKVYNGTITASGEPYISTELTARHSFLPFNTLVKVTNLNNKKSVIVRINDRFKEKTNRVIDLSFQASKVIELFSYMKPMVHLELIEIPKKPEESVGYNLDFIDPVPFNAAAFTLPGINPCFDFINLATSLNISTL